MQIACFSRRAAGALLALALAGPAGAQVATTAYRALGQPDLTRNGVNRLQGIELSSPSAVALDPRGGQTRIYVADTGNHRVLGWPDVQTYQDGEAPLVVLGQLSPEGSAPMGAGASGFNSPAGLAADPLTGALYVADTGNHRVLRFADPFANPGNVEAEAVFGQTDINGRSANGTGNGRNSLREPGGVALDRGGNLWIADTGNHRVLRYPSNLVYSSAPAADLVLGQRNFTENGRNRSGEGVTAAGFDTPYGIDFDAEGNLYVADGVNARLLRFSPPFAAESAAAAAIAMPAARTAVPRGVAVRDGRIYAALALENRVLVFSASGGAPSTVFGQTDLNGREANAGSAPRAAAFTLSGPAGVAADAAGNVFVADSGNHRVLRFASGSRSADRVWGQVDYVSNGVNQVKPSSLNGPSKAAVDYSQEPFAVYVSDTRNNRVLGWRDAARFRTGDPADYVIGQATMRGSAPNYDGAPRRPTRLSLSAPKGIAVDQSGNLWVADSGNNRVVRFPRPASSGGAAADLVLGQADFNSGAANIASAATLRSPSAVAIGPDGNVFVADTGNSRVLEYPAGAGNGAPALRVYGQPNFSSAVAPRIVSAQTLTSPAGVAVDAAFNLYVADTGANRVVVYANTRDAAPSSNAAAVVIGADRFDSVGTGAGRTRLASPSDVALDSSGRIYVADSGNHRVAVFPSLIFLPITDGEAAAAVGQPTPAGNTANWNSRDGFATAESLASPSGVFLDRRDTLYVADTGNHRVIHFLKQARIAHGVYPQASALGRGALVTITGEGLADSQETGPTPLASTLGGRQVSIEDSLLAPLVSVSPEAISLQMPSNAPPGAPRLAVRAADTGELIAGGSVAVATYAPGLYTKVTNQDKAVNSDTTPAIRGTVIRLLGTGQGPVSPNQPDGEAAAEGAVKTVAVPTTDGNTCLTRQPSLCVAIGNTFGDVKFSGLAAGMVGVWQLDVQIPENAPTGNVPVRAVINAVPSNIVTVAIR